MWKCIQHEWRKKASNCFNKNSTIAAAHRPESPDISTLQSSDLRTSEIETMGSKISTHIIWNQVKYVEKNKTSEFQIFIAKVANWLELWFTQSINESAALIAGTSCKLIRTLVYTKYNWESAALIAAAWASDAQKGSLGKYTRIKLDFMFIIS